MAPRKSKILSLEESEINKHEDDGGVLKPGPGRESFKLAAYWKSQVKAYEEATKRWFKRGNTVVKRFRDERNRIDEEGQRRMNLLWSNMKVMKPAIYSKCPIPIVDRKFLDRDPNARLSSQILERALRNEITLNGYHNSLNKAVWDRLLPGRGVVWVRYEPKIGEGDSIPAPTINGAEDPLYEIGKETGDKELTEDTNEEEKLETTQEQVLSEKTEVDYVDWHDFYIFPVKARTWEEVQAIGKKVYISKKEAKERFDSVVAKALKADTTPMVLGNNERQNYSDTTIFQDINERNIVVYEIWNKSDKRVYWVSEGYEYICDVMDDPLELTTFFPVPCPLFATTTNDSLIPIPDYIEWQDQAIQIDELTQRINMLSKACKVAGVYNSAAQGVGRLFEESVENELIPVDQWAMFADAGGIKGQVDFVPLEVIQQCLATLQEVRQQAIIDLDQITGLSDVVRGTTDSRETLGGIKLKNNNAGTRLSESQEEIARFARDTLAIVGEVICKHFSDETIIQSSGILYIESLQPDTVLEEFNTTNSSAQKQQSPQQPQGPSAPQAPQPQGGLLPLPAPALGLPAQMPPGAQMPGAQGIMPQGRPALPGNNIVPFPQPMVNQPPVAPQQNQFTSMLVPQAAPPDPQILIMMKIGQAIELLRDDVRRNYRIDIETDSTIFGDKYQDRQDATEFITALGGYMNNFEKLATAEPASLPVLAKTLQWGVRKFRTGRDLEASIDSFVEQMVKKAKQLADNPPPSPEMQKAQASIEQEKIKGQIQQQNDARDQQRQERDDQRQFQLDQAKDQRENQKMQQEAQIEKMRADLEMRKMQMEMMFKEKEHEIKMMELQAKIHSDQQKSQIDLQAKSQEAALDVQSKQIDQEHSEQQHQQTMQHGEREHQQAMKTQNEAHKAKMQQSDQAHKQKLKQKPKKAS